MNNYSAYLFDFDFTLADSSKGILKCFHIVLDRHGYTRVTDDEIRRTIGMTLENAFSQLTGIADMDKLASLRGEYSEEGKALITPNTFFYPESIPLLRKLKQRGAKTGIVSTKRGFYINQALEKNNALEFVDIVVGIENVSEAKPSPEGILLTLDKLGMRKEDVLYSGDSIIDAKAAEAASVDFVGITTGTTVKNDFVAYPYKKIISSLKEF